MYKIRETFSYYESYIMEVLQKTSRIILPQFILTISDQFLVHKLEINNTC